jgi:hypothetical protein
MFDHPKLNCPDCGEAVEATNQSRHSFHEIPRRAFLQTTGKAAVAIAAAPLLNFASPLIARETGEMAETLVKRLHDTLTEAQKKAVLLPWNDARRLQVNNNWRVVPQAIDEFYSSEQQRLIQEILQGVTSEEGDEKILRAMQDDMGGLGNYSACLFGDGDEKLAFMLTGRHQTIRADGGAEKNVVFGGPVFYGHAVTFNERPDHPGNVWWHQARLASKVFHALDGKQQKLALVLRGSPADNPASIQLQGEKGAFAGIPVSELSRDQKALVEEVIRSLLAPYRQSDIERVMAAVSANGGLDKLHLSFYQDGDLPDKDGIWDRWKLEGPSFVWYFRGSPHVHTWINIANNANI